MYFVACAWVIVSSKMADLRRQRFLFVFIDQWLCLIGFIINSESAWIRPSARSANLVSQSHLRPRESNTSVYS